MREVSVDAILPTCHVKTHRLANGWSGPLKLEDEVVLELELVDGFLESCFASHPHLTDMNPSLKHTDSNWAAAGVGVPQSKADH